MKKIVISLIITFTLLVLSNVESIAQCPSCPSPYSSYSVNFTYQGCILTANFCLDCAPTGHPVLSLCSVSVPSSCSSVSVDPNFWNAARIAMLTESVNICGNIGPCPERVAIDIYQAQCWQLVNDVEMGMVHIVPCDEEAGLCMREYEVCWDNGNLQITQGDAFVIDEGECDYEEIIIAPFPYSLFEGCFNSCY